MGFFTPSSSHYSSSHHRSPFSSSWSSNHRSGSSYYRRRPRDGFIQRMLYQIKRMLRDLYYYARRHPMKFFMLVVMPLITGGALTGVLRQFGIRLPQGMLGNQRGFSGDDGYGYSRYRESRSSGGGLGDLAGGLGNVSSIMKLAQMFM